MSLEKFGYGPDDPVIITPPPKPKPKPTRPAPKPKR